MQRPGVKGGGQQGGGITGTERRVRGDRETSPHSGWKGPLLGFEWRETDLTDILPWQRAANVVQVAMMVPQTTGQEWEGRKVTTVQVTLNPEPGMFPNP